MSDSICVVLLGDAAPMPLLAEAIARSGAAGAACLSSLAELRDAASLNPVLVVADVREHADPGAVGARLRSETGNTPTPLLLLCGANPDAPLPYIPGVDYVREPLHEYDLARRVLLLVSAFRRGVEASGGSPQVGTAEHGRTAGDIRSAGPTFLAEASRVLASSLDYATTLQSVCEMAVPGIADWCAVDLVDEDVGVRRVAIHHQDPEKVRLSFELNDRYPLRMDTPRGAAKVVRTGQPELFEEVTDEILRAGAHDEEHLRLSLELGFRSAIVTPLVARGRTLGAMTLIFSDSGRRYSARDLDLAGDLAGRAALAVDNAELYGAAQAELAERERVETALRESEARFRTMANSAPVMIWHTDPVGDGQWFNAVWHRFTGLSSSEAEGRAWMDHLHAEDASTYAALREQTLAASEPFTVEYRLRRSDGEYRWLLETGVPLSSGVFAGFIGSATDITEQKQLQHELQAHAGALSERDRHKDEFLAMLAHELRNPLGAITNAMAALNCGGADAALSARMRTIVERQSRHLARLVDDLLDVSRLTHGVIALRKERVDLAAMLPAAVEACRAGIEAWNHRLVLNMPPDPVSVEVDPARLEQIVCNLINNAAKYTPPGGLIQLTAETEAQQDGCWAVIRVQDNGAGMDPELIPRVFELFTQAERSLDRSQGGLGIGLTLVRQLAEMHGGTVEARSEGLGLGSEFIVRLPTPLERVQRPQAKPPAPSAAPRLLSVLVVEDNRDSAETLRELLELWGHRASIVYDGEAALRAIGDGAPPDVVLLDIGLPGVNGYEVARRLRASCGSDLALIALTGYGQEEDRRLSAEAGFDCHIVKPPDPNMLQHYIQEVTVRRL